MHEQSNMKKNRSGTWSLVYGGNTPQAGQPLPNAPEYQSENDAKDAATIRSIFAGRPTDLLTPDLREINFGALMRQPPSNMPRGGALSPKGDLGALRQREALKVFKNPIKGGKAASTRKGL